MEVYPAAHGFAVPDNATYDAAADERHRAALQALFGTHLRGAPVMPRKVADLDFTGLGPATPSRCWACVLAAITGCFPRSAGTARTSWSTSP